MLRTLIAVMAACLQFTPACAEIFTYSCRACLFPSLDGCDSVGNGYPLRVDDKGMRLVWRDKTYTIAVASPENGCAKFGWRAKGHSVEFNFCTATQGYGAIEDDDGRIRVQCSRK